MRNQATVTEQLFSQEAGTSTRVEMVDAAVSLTFFMKPSLAPKLKKGQETRLAQVFLIMALL